MRWPSTRGRRENRFERASLRVWRAYRASASLKGLAGTSGFLFRNLGFARHGHDSQRSNTVAFTPQYTETEAMERKTLTAFRDRARLVDHKSGDRGRFLVGKMPVHGAVKVADRHRTVDHHRSIGLGANARHHHVVLVGDVADDLFQNV